MIYIQISYWHQPKKNLVFFLARVISEEHAGIAGNSSNFHKEKQETDSNTLRQNQLHVALSRFKILL